MIWYSLLFEVIDFFVAKREKSGVALRMSLAKWETIAVKRHYRPRVIRLKNGIDPRWSEPANDPTGNHSLPIRTDLLELPSPQ
jgi:hypothetical protein